jgi:hypothetical protein
MGVGVEIFVTGEGVAARETFKSVPRLDEVTWTDRDGVDFEVVFVEFQPPGGSRQPILDPRGPFSGPLSSTGGILKNRVRTDAEDGSFFYFIHRNGNALEWLRPIGTRAEDNFGGVEVHGPPPRA